MSKYFENKSETIVSSKLKKSIKSTEKSRTSHKLITSDLNSQKSLPTSSNSSSASSSYNTSKQIDMNENWNFQKHQLPSTDSIVFNNEYGKLTDYYIDYNFYALKNQETLANQSTCIINYPDILENSLTCINKANTSKPLVFSNNDVSNSNYCLNEIIDDDDLNHDVISLNVDFSNEEEASEKNAAKKSSKKSEKINTNVISNKSELKLELDDLNPKRYTLELSTLSSSSNSSICVEGGENVPKIAPKPLQQHKVMERISFPQRHNNSKLVTNIRRQHTEKVKKGNVKSMNSVKPYFDDHQVDSRLNKVKHEDLSNKRENMAQSVATPLRHKERNSLSLSSSNSSSSHDDSTSSSESESLCSSKTSIRASLLLNNSKFNKSKLIKSKNEKAIPLYNPVAQTNKKIENKKSCVINDHDHDQLNRQVVEKCENHQKEKKKTIQNHRYVEKQNQLQHHHHQHQNLNQHNQHNYENMLEMAKQFKIKKLKQLQKKNKQAELKSKTIKAIAQHNSFRYFSSYGDNETHPYIDLLDDFLLVKIFTNLSTMDKLNLQFVCKRWHRIIWSNENSYKLFNSIEIVEANNCRSFQQSSTTLNQSSNKSNKKSNSFKTSTLSRFFRSKKSVDSKSSSANTTSTLSSSGTTSNQASKQPQIHLDLVLKFLLSKLLNRQTFPLCLCVESIKIKNSSRLTDKSIELISNSCPELKYLSIRHCVSVKATSLTRVIEKCENLKYLDVTGCFNLTQLISTSSTSRLSKTPEISNEGATFNLELVVREYFYLQFIDLSYCSSVNDNCVQNICKNCVFVKNLYLRKCKLITDISVLYIAKYCINLKELSLSQCVKITDVGIKYLANERLTLNNQHTNSIVNMSDSQTNDYYENRSFLNTIQNRPEPNSKFNSRYRIKYLSLAKCVQITDKSLIYLCKMGFFHQIKYLNLRGCTLITDKFLKYFTGFHGLLNYAKMKQQKQEISNLSSLGCYEPRLLPSIPLNLKSLDMAKCSITNKSLEYLCRLVSIKPDVLKRLSLRCCENITDDGIKLLALYCRNLQHLNVTKCSKITSNSLRDIKRNCKCCIIQHTNFSFC